MTYTPNGKHIVLAHGGGGQLTDELLTRSIFPRIANPALDQLLDAGIVDPCGNDRVAITTDSYVVTPWRFPGGDIGRLAVSGTVNDLAVCGAKPLGLALALIVSEGFARADLEAVLDSVGATAREAGVDILTGDTKVVGRGQGDGVYITTTGLGRIPAGRDLHPRKIQPDDVVLINGSIGEHGLAVMLQRELPEVQSVVTSDAAPLNGLIESLIKAVGDGVVFMRDATRSGLAGVASDIAQQTGLHVALDEPGIPIKPEALHAAEMLGLDPLEVANEGKVVAVVRPGAADSALAALQAHPLGRDAAIIGRVTDINDSLCEVHTAIGGRRILAKPYGEQLPRIC